MQATVELPKTVLQRIEALARLEGVTPAEMIHRLLETYLGESRPPAEPSYEVKLPLIPASETGPVRPVTGKDLDEVLADDHLASGR